jgi:hypothetical protein
MICFDLASAIMGAREAIRDIANIISNGSTTAITIRVGAKPIAGGTATIRADESAAF